MYQILLDENLSRKLNQQVESMFYELKHVSDFGLLKCDDREVWHFALEFKYTILTKDHDFQALSIIHGCPPKVIRLNCGNKSSYEIARIISEREQLIFDFLIDQQNCYLEIS